MKTNQYTLKIGSITWLLIIAVFLFNCDGGGHSNQGSNSENTESEGAVVSMGATTLLVNETYWVFGGNAPWTGRLSS